MEINVEASDEKIYSFLVRDQKTKQPTGQRHSTINSGDYVHFRIRMTKRMSLYHLITVKKFNIASNFRKKVKTSFLLPTALPVVKV